MVWQVTNRSTAGNAATAAVAAGSNSTYQTRMRSIYATLRGPAAGSGTMVVRDGLTGIGTIIFQTDLNISASGRDTLALYEFDIRATPGNVMTIEFTAGTPSDFQVVNAQGDYVPPGTPFMAPY